MTNLDWIVMLGTLFSIVFYGVYKSRINKNLKDYLKGGSSAGWATIGLSVMATQASAITFLSTPGQAFESGMGFVQFYFGLPIAMVIICVTVIPIFYRLKVYTAYEFLEQRFDLKTRLLAAFLFLVQRGLAAGITIYAPSIILSTILGWELQLTILAVGCVVVFYTVSGGTKAVSLTQKWQMAIIMGGMFLAFGILINYILNDISLRDAFNLASLNGKMQVVNFDFDINNRYTFWSGITGGLFLMLSYFGTDQSQVQRYLSGASIQESRLGLLFNGLMKVPMQFFILLLGVMLFVFYQLNPAPIHFNTTAAEDLANSEYATKAEDLRSNFNTLQDLKIETVKEIAAADAFEDPVKVARIQDINEEQAELKTAYNELMLVQHEDADVKDSDFVFLTFILNYLPRGVVGLLIAVILSAAMSSTAGELNALGTTTTIDFYKRLSKKERSDGKQVSMSKLFTVIWGVFAIAFALYAQLVDNLIEAVNILGSLFYGTILGIFVVAFFFKRVGSQGVFYAAIVSELVVISCYFSTDIGFLWYNVIGCSLVILLSLLFPKQAIRPSV